MWRREELASLCLGDLAGGERRLHIRAATSKSVHSRDITVPAETLKALDSSSGITGSADQRPMSTSSQTGMARR